jgi:cytochrome c-type biogenesis protein CcmE
VFLLYTSIAGGGTRQIRPSQLAGQTGEVSLVGVVTSHGIRGDAYRPVGLHFRVRDKNGTKTVRVLYRGSVPDLFKTGGDVVVAGRMQNGIFVARKDSLVTKCPSKYQPAKTKPSKSY